MRLRACLAFATFLIALGAAGAGAQDSLPPVTPFEPVLRLNAEAEVCDAFATAWQKVYEGSALLGEQFLDLESAYPGAEVFSFPPQPRRPGWYGGLYESSWNLTADLDGDGSNELLHIQGTSIGWRYMGVDIYGFGNEEAYRDATAVFAPEFPRSHFLFPNYSFHNRDTTPRLPRPLQLRPSDVAYVFSWNGTYYVTAAPEQGGTGHQTTAVLYRLSGTTAAETVCRLDLLPNYEGFEPFMRSSVLFQALGSIYGSGGLCMGTMGWTAPDMREHLQTLFHRPQVMSSEMEEPGRDPERKDAARELRLMTWGLSDPASWMVYEEFKDGRAAFVGEMTAYYRTHFADSDTQARDLAEQAYGYLVDGVVYGRQGDNELLTWIAWNAQPPINIEASATPAAIVDSALVVWSGLPAQSSFERYRAQPYNWERLALAAVYTRQERARIEDLWRRAEEAAAALESASDGDQQRESFAATRQEARNQLLLAALGESELVELALSLGADADAPTSYFKKTPLMYAAQGNDYASARLLLEHGADASAQTETKDPRCRPLERDHRTPLMYAAENASPKLIELLLDAGADPAMTDTQGNSALWYLERNQRLSAGEREALRQRLP